jgi:hypothetical protein
VTDQPQQPTEPVTEATLAYNRGWADGNASALDACNPVIDSAQTTIERLIADKDRLTADLAEARAAGYEAGVATGAQGVAALPDQWGAEAEIIETATHNPRGKALPRVRRQIAADALRACAESLRAAIAASRPTAPQEPGEAGPDVERLAVSYGDIETALRQSLDGAMVFRSYPTGDPYGRWAQNLWRGLRAAEPTDLRKLRAQVDAINSFSVRWQRREDRPDWTADDLTMEAGEGRGFAAAKRLVLSLIDAAVPTQEPSDQELLYAPALAAAEPVRDPEPPASGIDALDVAEDLRTIRRSLPAIVGLATAELWLAFGRVERALGRGIYAAAREPSDRAGRDEGQ